MAKISYVLLCALALQSVPRHPRRSPRKMQIPLPILGGNQRMRTRTICNARNPRGRGKTYNLKAWLSTHRISATRRENSRSRVQASQSLEFSVANNFNDTAKNSREDITCSMFSHGTCLRNAFHLDKFAHVTQNSSQIVFS